MSDMAIIAAVAGLVCVFLGAVALAATAMILDHLKAMRATSGEVAQLRNDMNLALERVEPRVKLLEDKVVAISNRLQSTR